MGIIKVVKYFFIVLTILHIGKLIAEENKTSGYGLFLSPESCLLLDKAKQCDMQVNINWKVPKPGSFCLYSHLNEIAIACWKNQTHASKEIMLTLENDVIFELRDQETGQMIFRKPLKLYKKISSLRRKRRNPWSFY
jgi:hypothetical protein